MTTTRFIIDILIVLFTCFGLPVIVGVLCTRQINKRLRQQREIHERAELARQRLLYIGQLRTALRKCERYLSGCSCWSPEAQRLNNIIHDLTTAVDSNGKPLEKTTDASNT